MRSISLGAGMGADILARILRDPRESPSRCSLTPLRGRGDLLFTPFDVEACYDAGGFTLLHHGGPALGAADRSRALLLIDSSWRRLEVILRRVGGGFQARSLPAGFVTAYPRRSRNFPDPAAGLASIEALHAALSILGRRDDSLLEHYRWREEYLAHNQELLQAS